jgi:hypothetical protein
MHIVKVKHIQQAGIRCLPEKEDIPAAKEGK